jgi:hypothetical protein
MWIGSPSPRFLIRIRTLHHRARQNLRALVQTKLEQSAMSCRRIWLSRKNAHASPIDEYAAGIMIEMVHKVLATA